MGVPLLVLALSACGGGDSSPAAPDPGDDDDNDPIEEELGADPEPDASADTFCETLGYHCTADDVSDAAFDRSDELLSGAMAELEGGRSNEDLVDWLEDQEGVVETDATDGVVVFRVQGGQPTWLLTPPEDPDPQAPPTDVEPPARDAVVGHGTARENAAKTKTALVLAPFQFENGSHDPSPAVAAILRNARDYAHSGGVTEIGNTTEPSAPSGTAGSGQPTVDDFRGWNEYDVIMVTTHGSEMSSDGFGCSLLDGDFFCLGGVATGERVGSCGAVKTRYPDTPGIRCASISDDQVNGNYLLLDTDFFDWEYGTFVTGLDRAIVYMGGCETFANGSLAYQLAGDRSEYFGWDGKVYESDMKAPAERLFHLLVEDGLTTEKAFDRMEGNGSHSTRNADLDLRTNDGGLHIREITTMRNPLHPSVSGGSVPPLFASATRGSIARLAPPAEGELLTGDVIPFIGRAEDGETDELLFFVDVDGVEPGDEGDYKVRIEVDGEELGTWDLEGEHAARLDGSTVRIRIREPVDFDVQAGQTVDLVASTELPGDDESLHEASPLLDNPNLRMTSTIRSSSPDVAITSEVKADLELFLQPGDTPEKLELGSSTGPVEYVRYEVDAPLCTVTTSTVDGRIELVEGEVQLHDPEADDFGVPEELLLIVYPEISETYVLFCPGGGSQSVDTIHWYAGLVSFHSGGFGFENEFDTGRGGYSIEDWQPGTGEVYARREYERQHTGGNVTLEENTTFEFIGPTTYGGS